METGWIKIHRKINEHWIWNNADYLKWWLDLIMLANHKPAKILINNKLVSMDQGMYHTSVEKLSERWSVDRKAVFRFLDLLVEDSMITINKSRQDGTTIKLSNYAAYQTFYDDGGATGKTSKGSSAGHQRDINKNVKNGQEKKEINPCPSGMGGYARAAIHGEDGGASQDAPYRVQDGPGCVLGAGVVQMTMDMPKRAYDSFNAFWEAYPKKVSKGDARKAWKQIQPDGELLAKILASLERAKACAGWIKDGGQYIPYPATWLRAEGWEDEIGPAHRAAPRPQRRET